MLVSRLVPAVVAVGFFAVLQYTTSSAGPVPGGGPPPTPGPGPAAEAIDHFKLRPTGPGAIPFADLLDQAPAPATESEKGQAALPAARRHELTTDTKASVRQVLDWADAYNGADVHAAWSDYTTLMQARAELAAAEYASGLTGYGEAALPTDDEVQP